MATLFLIRGIPGAGKSTLAKSLFESGMVDISTEADEFMLNASGEYEFNAGMLSICHAKCKDMAKYALGNNLNIAVSNTSTTEREVSEYANIANQYGAKFVSMIIENRHDGVSIHEVPKEKIAAMKNRFSVKL